ncbi:MAG: DEAD/DEAH box helicase, partial [Myxococcota bacterium]|nr:DEAD/DEAH box helicase [Myxococcota bacterium]
MLPSALLAQLETGLADFLRASFHATTPGFRHAIERLIAEPGALTQGPFVELALPFAQGSQPHFFPRLPLDFVPYLHQERAFVRLGQDPPRSTIIATGTGSGKTECFLYPILAHCLEHAEEPGIKAILIYPMNALASDQALRIARTIDHHPALREHVRAGLYIGEGDGKQSSHVEMGPEHLITERDQLRKHPPDILLTNYKMLDYMLLRPRDRLLWDSSSDGSLRFLVVDELHSFDGAQGTDLACLLRRLRARIKARPHQLCCIGTSATLGGDDDALALRDYAASVFGTPFDEDAIIRETRLDLERFRGDAILRFIKQPELAQRPALDPSRYADPDAFIAAQLELWFETKAEAAVGSDAWRVEIGTMLRQHVSFDNLLRRLRGGVRPLDELIDELALPGSDLRTDPAFGRAALLSLLALVSAARSASARKLSPFVQLRLQLWQREMRRMLGSVGKECRLRFHDDLRDEQRREHLPVIHCRECGAMGWAALEARNQSRNYRTEASTFYRAFFSADPRVRFIFPASVRDGVDTLSRDHLPYVLDCETLFARPVDAEPCAEHELEVLIYTLNSSDGKGRLKLSRDCPFCHANQSLSLLGFQAATLTSVYIDQLFASTFNEDKKLLAFSDSVQDAAHRAGFFGARTWRSNLRIAIQRVVEACCAEDPSLTLAQLAQRFEGWWRGPGGMELERYVATFLAPNMAWLADYDALCQDGVLPPGSELLDLVRRRLAWEIFSEYGMQLRIGRSLTRTRVSMASPEAARFERCVQALLPRLQNDVGALRELQAAPLRVFLIGFLSQLQERGGILHPELPKRYLRSGGKDVFVFHTTRHLPDVGPGSRLPAMLMHTQESQRFDVLCSPVRARPSRYQRWYQRTLGEHESLAFAESERALPIVVRALLEAGLLAEEEGERGTAVWGLRPEALQLSREVSVVQCARCGYTTHAAPAYVELWRDAPCPAPLCQGRCVPSPQAGQDYFGRLYTSGQVQRIFPAEHTGLLSRAERETLETQFKGSGDARRPWHPNLLSCTPTLEMGIDVGELSTAILCSIPPTQASYLQRMGRAGRRDGNALVLSIANARPHDLYFYGRPEEMLAGRVETPGLYLNAAAVLERQLSAFVFDCWSASGVGPEALPRKMGSVYSRLGTQDSKHFPHNLRLFLETHGGALLEDFLLLFEGAEPGRSLLSASTQAQLRRFMGSSDDIPLYYRLLEKLHTEAKVLAGLREQRRRLREQRQSLEAQPQDEGRDEQLGIMARELKALSALIKHQDELDVLAFLTEQGLLPNYAFPEAPVRLQSVIWRRRSGAKGKDYESQSYSYARPGSTAISELAPENVFYASGREVSIDQIDVNASSFEDWRFCNACSHTARVSDDAGSACPNCGSTLWPDPGQVHTVLRLRQVYANTEDRRSRLGDDRDDRFPRHYARQDLMTFQDKDRGQAWGIDSDELSFAFEYLHRAKFRELNFGHSSEDGVKVTIAGRESVRSGFVLCRHCGKVQKEGADPSHAIWCVARGRQNTGEDERKGGTDYRSCVWLYREFESEAVRILVPTTELDGAKQMQSFIAALHMGLRLRFGGRVEHLRSTEYSEPLADAPESSVRKNYLVLFDTVPGGTGYLADLCKQPEALFELFELARKRMLSCSCAADPEKDGCYRCLYAYRSARELSALSRQAAVQLLTRILSKRAAVKELANLGEVSVKGLLDSALEAHFLEALRGEPSQLSPAIVAGKPGFRWSVGERSWLIEPQHEIAANEGLGLHVSIDFLFRSEERDGANVAVFLDGWQYHRERVARDALQRRLLVAGGKAEPWSFSWWDVRADAQDEDFRLLPFPHPHLLRRREGLSAQQLRVLEQPSLRWFVDSMSGKLDVKLWRKLAWTGLFWHSQRLDAETISSWRAKLASWPVQEAASFIEEALDFEPVGYAVAPSPELPWSMFAVTTAQALREDWGRPEDPQGM